MKTIIVAKAVVLGPDGKLLALRRSKTDSRRPLQWDIPGGWVDEGEELAAATAREIKEEAGITIAASHLHLVHATSAVKKPHGSVVWLFFVAKTAQTDVTLSYEHAEYTWMSLDEALEQFEYAVQIEALAHIKNHQIVDDLPL